MDALTFIDEAVAVRPFRLLDIGCGSGVIAAPLQRLAGEWIGIDPSVEAIAAARARGLDARCGGAEALPFEAQAFDVCLFLNSLHHVPIKAMDKALDEALRVGHIVIVIEPMAEGGLYSALLPIDDETLVRDKAQKAISRTIEGGARCLREQTWIRTETYPSFEVFLERMIAAEQSRAEPARLRRAEIEASFSAAATKDADGTYKITQPMIGHVLTQNVEPAFGMTSSS